MNYPRLIHEYLDGGLASNMEDLLFLELAHNSDLRQEFNSQVKLQFISQNDMNNITPPLASTGAIFSSLGFTMPSTGLPGMQNTAMKGNAASFSQKAATSFRKIFPNVMTSVLTVAFTGIVLYFLFDYSFTNRLENLSADIKSNIPVSSSIETPSSNTSESVIGELSALREEISSLKKQLLHNNRNNNIFASSIPAKEQNSNPYSSDNNAGFVSHNTSINDNSDDNVPVYLALQESGYNPNNQYFELFMPQYDAVYTFQGEPITYIPITTEIKIPTGFDEFTDNTNWGLEFRGIASSSNPSVKINDASNSMFANSSIGVFYRIAKQHSVGIETGQESFGMSFYTIEDGNQYLYEQNPMLWWYGAFYRYSATNLGYKQILYPFAQVFAGASSIGPIGKLNIGLEYRPIENISLSIGLETKRLWYVIQDNNYSTNKTGVNYGISILY